MSNPHTSLWWDTLPASLRHQDRPALHQNISVDVVIVGAGYTGLWTAYYLKQLNPDLRIAILEAQTAGFGASGRNGGWCSALFPTSIDKLSRKHGPASALAMQHAMHDTVSEVKRVIDKESIDCDWHQGGTLYVARSELQHTRAKDEIISWREWGFDAQDYALLDKQQTEVRIKASGAFGAMFTPHCAAIHPAKLVRGLAQVVENLGVTIYENSPVTQIESHLVHTPNSLVTADYVVRATEGYTPSLKNEQRTLAPVYSLMLATEPLPESTWEEIGLTDRETFTDYRNLIIYGQRTADNRLAFGGRGAPYHFGSQIRPEFDSNAQVHNALVEVLTEIFPVLRGVGISHRWGGPLGIPRDWMASCGLEPASGLAWSGGYVGDGVGSSNLGGRTLAHLITGVQSPITSLPWVNHISPRWEPEPLRWIGANTALKVMTLADSTEHKTGKPSRLAGIVNRFLGH